MSVSESMNQQDVTSNFPSNSSKIFSNTVILLDWDDTLFPSSYLAEKGYRLDTQVIDNDVLEDLKLVEFWVAKLLKCVSEKGEVHIITNAETGWVQLSASRFIPSIVPMFDQLRVTSARSAYEEAFPGSPLKWKFFAFRDNISFLSHEESTLPHSQVISLGDSNYEREAVRAVTRNTTYIKTKSVKFHERPTVNQILKQIELVIKSFDFIHTHDGDLDLQLSLRDWD